MARTFPARFDASTNSSAERRLYEALARQLDDEWAVLHHVMWIGDDEFGLCWLLGTSVRTIAHFSFHYTHMNP